MLTETAFWNYVDIIAKIYAIFMSVFNSAGIESRCIIKI